MKTSFAFRALLGVSLVFAGASLPVQATPPTHGTVSGRLYDGQTQEPIPHSYVVLLRASDGRFVKAVATNARGEFRADKLPLGRYTMRTTVLGYHAVQPAVALRSSQPHQALGTVVLVPLTMPQVARADRQAWAKRTTAVATLEPRRPAVRVRS